MRKVNITDVAEDHRVSPKGGFELRRRHISLAIGGVKDTGPWGGGHPFDVELTEIPPGKSNFPLHSHAAQTEHYIILSGIGEIVDEQGFALPLTGGDHVICHPGNAHQITNGGQEPLRYYVIADHHRADVITYPHTGKKMIKPEQRVLTVSHADYYEGEE